MEGKSQQSLDQFASTSSPGDNTVELHMLAEQPLPPKDERIVSINLSPDESVSRASRNVKNQRATSETSVAITTMHPFNAYPQEQGFHYGGYGNGTGNQDEHSNYVNSNSLHVIPMAMYNENPPLYFPPGYGFDSQIAYGQFSPLANPLSPVMIDNHLFSPHQMPMSPSYYPPVSPGLPHVTSALSLSQSELVPSASSGQENLNENAIFGPGSGYYLPFGSFGGDISGTSGLGLYNFPSEFGSGEPFPNHSSALETNRFMSPLTSGTAYPHPIGILGPYEQNVAQTPIQGFGLMSNSSARHYPHVGSYQSTGGSPSNRNRFVTDKGRRHAGDRDSANISIGMLSFSTDRNRGPRASKTKEKNFPEEGSSSGIYKEVNSTSGFHGDQFNSPDFITDYENAKFFVIKSFSEDNVHKSIKYGIWASTPLGNRKLDAAYHEAKEMKSTCPVFLIFSVNASGQFCGVAEMVGTVDFENDSDYWQQDRWSGQFPVKWHIIKDVPNSQFRHILLENNENKPVTHSRDSQEVKLEQGLEILKIFKNHDADTSLLDDFNFYDEREKSLLERKAKQRASATTNTASTLAAESINQLSNNLANALRFESDKHVSHTELE